MTDERFDDRRDAGRRLAERLTGTVPGGADVIVLALPRGGVPVAHEVASALHTPLDVLVVRKLGVPGHEELAMGAVAAGVVVVDDDIVAELGIDAETIERVIDRERTELARREHEYRGDRAPVDVREKTVVLVDDGLATGSTMRAALRALAAQHPSRVIVAVPVGAPATCAALAAEGVADAVVCLVTPERFHAVGEWYRDFTQTSDGEVRALLTG